MLYLFECYNNHTYKKRKYCTILDFKKISLDKQETAMFV